MEVHVLPDAASACRRAAELIAAAAVQTVEARGRFLLALSGGTTGAALVQELADAPLPWHAIHLLQVDERVAPVGDAERNLEPIRRALLATGRIAPERVHGMAVESDDLDAAAARYAATLRALAGSPPVLDLVHLGLGTDGHTASLVPGDPLLDVHDGDVAPTGTYNARRRLTLTLPVLNRARRVLWLVTGGDKAEVLARLQRGNRALPASRVRQDRAVVVADRAAAAHLDARVADPDQ